MGTKWSWNDHFLVYIQCFDIIAKDTTQLHVLKCAKCATGQMHAFSHLIPHFGQTADTRLMTSNSLEHSRVLFKQVLQ
ncbi:hypothetical protein JVU11DRAFT_11964 [Chiua virens]|nr:hypothetical protein JVU11DRAFT_11964 [Chiua virens]